VVSAMIVVIDERADLPLKVARQIVVLEQDPVLHRLMPALDLALGHRVVGGAADMRHLPVVEPLDHAVRADYGNGQLIDLDIPYYEQKGYLPPWRSLDPCLSTGPKRPKRAGQLD